MNSKTLSKILSLIVVCILCVSNVNVSFASDNKIRQINANMPKVTVEVKGDYDKNSIDFVKLGNEKLSIEDVHSAKDAKSKAVYVLIDSSTSMSQPALNALKPRLIEYANSLKADDKFVVMTFGKTVQTVLKGGESKKVVEQKINAIKCNSPGTSFFDAITKALNDSLSKEQERKYAIVISDGIDYDKGNNSQDEVVSKIETNRLPIYGMCLSTSNKASTDSFGYMCRTSGGELVKFGAGDASLKFNSLKSKINDVTIISAKSKSKKSAKEKQIIVSINEKQYTDIATLESKKDTTPPEVEDISYDKESNSFIVQFSESVDNAGNNASFKVKKGSKELTFVNVKYFDDENKTQIDMEKRVYSGEYTFEFFGITDSTDQENPLSSSKTVDVKATPIIVKILIIVGICMIPVVFLLALYLILLNIKKKKNVTRIKDIFITQVEETEVENIHHVHIDPQQGGQQEPKGRKISLFINCGDGTTHNIEYNLVNSMIIGRSEICDVTIVDGNMSRQHFAIEDVETGLAIIDLETTNGTYINGVQIHSKTFIPSGGKVTAGDSYITVTY